MHGGSGTPGHYFNSAVKIGVSKVNINTDMRIAYRQTLEKVLEENKSEFAVVKLMDTVIDAVQAVVEEKMDMFNAAGKSNRHRTSSDASGNKVIDEDAFN